MFHLMGFVLLNVWHFLNEKTLLCVRVLSNKGRQDESVSLVKHD